MTVHRACERLISIGYIQSRPKIGTYVSDTPPHLFRYGIAFPSRPDGVSYWTDFWTILRSSAKAVAKADPPKQIVTYYGITGHSDVEDYQRLIADVRMRRLAGVILLSGPQLLLNTPLFEEDCPVPRVYIGGNLWRWRIPSVAPELHSFLHRGLEHAARLSRHRPMLISHGMATETAWAEWSEACRAHGAVPERWQILSVPLNPWEAAAHLTQVLMQLPPDRRPDTLIVSDDHHVEAVTAGLLLSKLPERELPIVIAHANFPKKPRALLPVTYLGFDSLALIRACIDVLDTVRRGEAVPPVTAIRACFASELPPANDAHDSMVLTPNHFVGERDAALADPDPFPPNL
jgi:hypothetical protein